jgi:hypothetical protein
MFYFIYFVFISHKVVVLDNHHGGVGDMRQSSLFCRFLEEDI